MARDDKDSTSTRSPMSRVAYPVATGLGAASDGLSVWLG